MNCMRTHACKVLRPGPVQGSGFRFWPGHQVWPGRPGQFFKKNQNDVVLVKKNKKNKSQWVCHRVLPGQPGPRVDPAGQPGHTGFFLLLFFHQPGPVPTPDRPDPRSTHRTRPDFKTMHAWSHVAGGGGALPVIHSPSLKLHAVTN